MVTQGLPSPSCFNSTAPLPDAGQSKRNASPALRHADPETGNGALASGLACHALIFAQYADCAGVALPEYPIRFCPFTGEDSNFCSNLSSMTTPQALAGVVFQRPSFC